MYLHETETEFPVDAGRGSILEQVSSGLGRHISDDEMPVRIVVAESTGGRYKCEVALLRNHRDLAPSLRASVLRFRKRLIENSQAFNAVLLVPTGVGAEIGGHAGDATPVATLLASICDTLITHPNVLNGSDLIDISPNTLYVEGSAISRLLMGSIGLQPVRSNRVLVVVDAHQDEFFVDAAINAVHAARSSYGLICPMILRLEPPLDMRSQYMDSGRVGGTVEGIDRLVANLNDHRRSYDAVAISSVIAVPLSYHIDYFESDGNMLNPWGGVEAMLTHTISTLFDVPSAHSPMLENQEIANMETGVVDPRMAAEAISLTFMQSVLKGLQRSPKIVTGPEAMAHHGVLTASDVSCLVIPDGCLGLPTLAALEQGIPVIAVRENRTVMKNDLTLLPWAPGQFHPVANYWEAAGVMAALKAGIDPKAVRRPITQTTVRTSTAPVSSIPESVAIGPTADD
ncbi:MAG: DUF3326 domain-containing protein [Dehalococcoidia bacterium]|jgi:hypothetical protein|nr:DUF3326 domain-containing protein [Dehalococcoidia bacterium]MDP6228842.1 DUF3326 domain-containing protein [Dehalococcoidia bacterium]MDP7085048.1 DUF3326 domain-containing protein [Dehalococcoidia bacterium]MDP7202000.1 DUF3326 domain-containing protein [Dehalococcoidia bacterium]HJN85570.1 DUF3326 domain-containing protein [Dehalococcoidia bacterium]